MSISEFEFEEWALWVVLSMALWQYLNILCDTLFHLTHWFFSLFCSFLYNFFSWRFFREDIGLLKLQVPISPWDIGILGWCTAESVLPRGEKVPFNFGWSPFQWWCHNKNTLWSRCFIATTTLTSHLFLLG